jgi:hypothetical protein
MLSLEKHLRELETEIDSLKKNRERFDNLEFVKKAFISGYGSRHYDPKGWESNVVSGYVERTRGSATYRNDEYVTLVIETKLMTIKLEYTQTHVDEYTCDVFINDVPTDTIENVVGDFERDLVYTMLSEMPYTIYWFENTTIREKFYANLSETEDEINIEELI